MGITKKLITCLLLLWVSAISCSENKQKEKNKPVSKAPNRSINFQSLKETVPSPGTLLADGAPKTTSLPFWSKDWPKHGKKTITQNKNYPLPAIRNIKYMNLDSLYQYQCTNGGPITSDVLKLSRYNYRFPDIDKYQVFYNRVSGESLEKDPLAVFIKNNCNMHYDEFGYLILYDPLAMNAVVLNVENSYYIDAVEERDFFIDKDHTIYLLDRSWTDGDDTRQAYTGGHRRTLSILKNGEIKVIEIK